MFPPARKVSATSIPSSTSNNTTNSGNNNSKTSSNNPIIEPLSNRMSIKRTASSGSSSILSSSASPLSSSSSSPQGSSGRETGSRRGSVDDDIKSDSPTTNSGGFLTGQHSVKSKASGFVKQMVSNKDGNNGTQSLHRETNQSMTTFQRSNVSTNQQPSAIPVQPMLRSSQRRKQQQMESDVSSSSPIVMVQQAKKLSSSSLVNPSSSTVHGNNDNQEVMTSGNHKSSANHNSCSSKDRKENGEEKKNLSESGEDRSEIKGVLSDFQSAWMARFPGCDLPSAWEEDVRSNLMKHRKQVEVLKEELEKEQFYVEYLEKLLMDVEKVRKGSTSSLSSTASKSSLNGSSSIKSPAMTSNGKATGSNPCPAVRSSTESSLKQKDNNGCGQVPGDQYVTVINVSSTSNVSGSSSVRTGGVVPGFKGVNQMNRHQLTDNPLYQDFSSASGQTTTKLAAENNEGQQRNTGLGSSNNSHQSAVATRTGVRSGSVKNITSGFNAAAGNNNAVTTSSTTSFATRNSRSSSGSSSVSKNGEGDETSLKSSSLVIVSSNDTSCQKGKQLVESRNGGGSNEALSTDGSGNQQQGGRKRPPTPPRKPRINPRDFPGLQFMGKDGFGVADNLSTGTPSPSKSSPENTLEHSAQHAHSLHSSSSPQSSLVKSSSHSPGPLINPESSSKIIELKPTSRLATISHDSNQQIGYQRGGEEPAYATRLVAEIANEMVHSPGTVLITGGVNESAHRYPSQHSLDASVELDFNDVHGAEERRKERRKSGDEASEDEDDDENCTTTETETTATEVNPSGLANNTNSGSNFQYRITTSSSRDERLDKSDSINDDLSLTQGDSLERDERLQRSDEDGKLDHELGEGEDSIYDTVAPDEDNGDSNYVTKCESNSIEITSSTLPTSSTEYELISRLRNGIATPASDIDLASHFGNVPSASAREIPGHLNRDVSNSNLSLSAVPPSGAKYSSSIESSFANYVNIDYFLRKDETASSKNDSDDAMSRSVSSDHDDLSDGKSIESYGSINRQRQPGSASSSPSSGLQAHTSKISAIVRPMMSSPCVQTCVKSVDPNATYDEVFHDPDLYGAYYGVVDSDPITTNDVQEQSSNDHKSSTDGGTSKLTEEEKKAEAERLMMYKCIISSITESETVYVDCLNTLLQYMKAIKSTIGTSHPLVSPEDLAVIFYKIPDLHSIHCQFLNGLKRLDPKHLPENEDDDSPVSSVGELFKNLASRLGAYSAFLKNYTRALETVSKCSAENNQFSEVTRAIKLKSMKGQSVTLEDLLHKPVARVQKNALVLHDLLKYCHESSSEYASLCTALRMSQCFLNDLNIAATEQMFPVQDKTQRRLVKESFIIESIEGRRKLRHLFLFNDIIVCAKYRPSTRQRFTFDVKWYAMLSDITLPELEDPTNVASNTGKEKETSSSEMMALRTKLSSLRGLMSKEERGSSVGGKPGRIPEKYKKKQAELEGQLVLLLPQLPLNISIKNGKCYTFFLSSEYERTQWIESVKVLQTTVLSSSDPCSSHQSINIHELQAWIETCRKALTPSVGSFLLRSTKDEDLLSGDLYMEIKSLKGLSRPADLFFVVEVDTFGHFFSKATTKVSKNEIEPKYDQEFVLDLDGSKVVRILCYESVPGHPTALFRGKANLELSRSWLSEQWIDRNINMLDSTLSIRIKFVSSESSTIRFPAGKVYGAFGSNIQTVCKKEKSSIPFLIVGCVREVERRGLKEQGIYRVSGINSDVQKLKKAFESNPYEAEHLLKDIDIHAVTGLLKMYLRELPEALFTSSLYQKFFDAFSIKNVDEKSAKLIELYGKLPAVNQNTITFLIDHLVIVNQHEPHNKMSLHNLATVFGPTMIRPAPGAASGGTSNQSSSSAAVATADSFTAGTIDVMAQAGILYFFLKRKVSPSEAATHC